MKTGIHMEGVTSAVS